MVTVPEIGPSTAEKTGAVRLVAESKEPGWDAVM
jgi:hypothetical protein